ncbi:MAG: Trm112 family protein [Bacteroidetes bacterium]|nr:MAG: Trm112 family protein [Bacteroidota bacterium]
MLSAELLNILCCPECEGEVHSNEDQTMLICSHCHLTFPIRENIPIMIIHQQNSSSTKEDTNGS